MFNVALLAAGRKSQKVKLTDRQLGRYYYGQTMAIRFHGNGRLTVYDSNSGTDVADEWHFPRGAVSLLYEFRYTIEANVGALVSYKEPNLRPNVWERLTNDFGEPASRFIWISPNADEWLPGYGMRVFMQVREIATQEIVASARYWTPGFAPNQ